MNEFVKTHLNNLINNIKKHPYSFGTLVVLVIILIPVIIWFSYLSGDTLGGIPTHISAGDSLGFYGSVLSFVGTVALGALALYQNNLFRKENDKRTAEITKLEKDLLIFQNYSNNILYSCQIIISKPDKSKNCNENLHSDELTEYGMSSIDLDKVKNEKYIKNFHLKANIANYSNALLQRIEINFGETCVGHTYNLSSENKNVCLLLPLQTKHVYICQVKFVSAYNVATYGTFELGVDGDPTDCQPYSIDCQRNATIRNYKFYGTEMPILSDTKMEIIKNV